VCELLDVAEHVGVVRGADTGDWVPALRGEESSAAALLSRSRAAVVSDDDVSECGGIIRPHLIDQRIKETEGFAGDCLELCEEERDNGGEYGSRLGCSTDECRLSSVYAPRVVSDRADVGETASVDVVVAGRRHRDAGRGVLLDGVLLPGRTTSDVAEAAAAEISGERIGDGRFVTAADARVLAAE